MRRDKVCECSGRSDRNLQPKYPNVTFDLVTGTADVLKEQMDRGLMDVALLLEPVDVGKYEFVRLKEGERQQVLMRPDDPLAQKKSYIRKI